MGPPPKKNFGKKNPNNSPPPPGGRPPEAGGTGGAPLAVTPLGFLVQNYSRICSKSKFFFSNTDHYSSFRIKLLSPVF